MSTTESRTSRLNTRLTPRQKELFQRAADLQGRSLTDFVVEAAMQRAEEVISTHEIIRLSERDREVFFEALRNPPEPGEALKRAAADYWQAVDQD